MNNLLKVCLVTKLFVQWAIIETEGKNQLNFLILASFRIEKYCFEQKHAHCWLGIFLFAMN